MFRKWLVTALAVAFLAGGLIGCEPQEPGRGGEEPSTAEEPEKPGTAEAPEPGTAAAPAPGTATE